MRIHVVNPNTTASMTAKIAAAARAVAAPGIEILAQNPADGPVSIEGFYDEAFAVPSMLTLIREADEEGAAGHVIACFDDTGLEAARSVAGAPVVGIGEAAFHLASLVAGKFSVVTTLARSVQAIEHNLTKYGLDARCARVRSSDCAVLALEEAGSNARAQISAEIGRAIAEDRAEAIVLGCAGMTDLASELAGEHGVPVVDGVAAAVKLVEALAALGLRTSKLGGYAAPLPKPYRGLFSAFSPR
jgi:allantoin racemase